MSSSAIEETYRPKRDAVEKSDWQQALRSRWLWLGLGTIFMIGALGYWLWPRAAKSEPTTTSTQNPTGTVKFLMEQQWLIRMKLTLVEERTVARQITSTGRVIPAADYQAHVASPVSAIVAGNLPRVGQHVTKGQILAVLQQTATSAEQAQVHSQNAQAAVENARLEADRRAAESEVEEARKIRTGEERS